MNETILIATACAEAGLLVGYSLKWFQDCRVMAWCMADAIARRTR